MNKKNKSGLQNYKRYSLIIFTGFGSFSVALTLLH